MIEATELKNGTTFLSGNEPYKVIKYNFIKLGRGGAIVRVTAKNLESGSTEEKTFSSNNKVEDISTNKKLLQYLYTSGSSVFFMDPKSFEQVQIPYSIIESEIKYIKEGQEATVLFWDDKPLAIEVQPKVVMEVVDTPPGVKGNTASNIYKPATLENGIIVKVPLFVKKGEKIVVDTRSGEYVERSK